MSIHTGVAALLSPHHARLHAHVLAARQTANTNLLHQRTASLTLGCTWCPGECVSFRYGNQVRNRMISESEAVFDDEGGFVGRYTGDPDSYNLVDANDDLIQSRRTVPSDKHMQGDIVVDQKEMTIVDLDAREHDSGVRACESVDCGNHVAANREGWYHDNQDADIHISWLVTNTTVSSDLRREYDDPAFLPRPANSDESSGSKQVCKVFRPRVNTSTSSLPLSSTHRH